jgi:two-component system response regulator LytT
VLDNPSMLDILYLDILLNKKTGMDVAHELRKRGSKTKIIFLTASYEYILDAFDVQPVNYLIKHQFGTEKFIQVLKQALNQIEEDRKKIFYCEYKGNKYMIPLHKIQYFEVWNKMITIYHDDQQTKFYARLSDVIDKLNPEHFIQVHRSYIINLAQVTEIKKNTIILKHNLQIPIGKTYVQQFEKAFEDFMLNSETLKLGDDVS